MTLELHETAAIRAMLRDDWDELHPRLLAIAQRVVRRREVAEDVVSAAVIETIGRVDAGEEIRDLGAYLARGVRFRAIDVVRSKDGQAVVGSEVADTAIASITDTRLGAMAIDDSDALAPVREAFGALSQRHREVLARTVIDDEPVRDVARDWGMTPNSVAVLALRARRSLRSELKAVLMERAGGDCAVYARRKDRPALAHVSRCDHCLDVRGGRGVGRWVFAVLPLLVGGGAVAVSPANVAQALVGSIVRKPLVAGASIAGAAAVTTTVVVVAVAALTPAETAVVAAPPTPPAAAAPATDPDADAGSDADDSAGADATEQPTTIVGPGESAPIVVAPEDAPIVASPTAPVVEGAKPGTPGTPGAPAEPVAPVAPVAPTDPEPTMPAEPVTPVEPTPPPELEPPVVPTPPTEPTPDPDPVDPPVDPTPPTDPDPEPVPALTIGTSPVWSETPLLTSATFTIGGLVEDATYQLDAPNGLLAATTPTSGMECGPTGSCVATRDAAEFRIDALGLVVLCTAPHAVTITPTSTTQAPITVLVPQLDGLICLSPDLPGSPGLGDGPEVPGLPALPPTLLP